MKKHFITNFVVSFLGLLLRVSFPICLGRRNFYGSRYLNVCKSTERVTSKNARSKKNFLWSKERHSLPLQVMEQPRELFLVLKEIHFRYTLIWIRDFLLKWSHKLKLTSQILVCNSEFVCQSGTFGPPELWCLGSRTLVPQMLLTFCCLKSLTLEFKTFLSGWYNSTRQ